jgi:hypothetical protein
MFQEGKKSKTLIISLIAIFAAIYAVIRIFPTFPLIGISGASFSLADILAPIYGIILGPVAGPISILVGTLLGFFGRPIVFLGLDFLPAFMSSLIIGLLIRRKWLLAVTLYTIIFVMFLIHPFSVVFVTISGVIVPFHWAHILTFFILISPLSYKAVYWITNASIIRLVPALIILNFIGTFIQHSTGSILWETIYGMIVGIEPDIFHNLWNTIFWIYPIERFFLILLSTIVGTVMIKTLKAVKLVIVY